MSFNAGSAYIGVKPDFGSFQSDIKAQFTKFGDDAGKVFADSFKVRVKAALADLPNPKITADADTAKARADLDDAAKTRTAKIKVQVDKVGLQNPVSGISPLVGAGLLGGVALGPQALGLGAGVAGIGVALGAAAVTAGAFGAIAVPMFTDVSKAQAALTTATTAYNKATTDAGRASALKAEQAALAGLTPAERQLATELSGLESAWKNLSKAEQPVVGQALAPWLATATSGMQLLKPVIGDASEAIGILGQQAQTAFTAPFWGTFFSTLGNTGRISIEDFGSAIGKVGDGLAHLFVTFAPDINQLPPLIDKAATSFDKWATSVTSAGLTNFFEKTFSPANVATLKTDLGDIATVTGNVAKAGASLSPTAFSGLSNVLDVLAKLSPGQIEGLTAMFLAAKTVGGIGNLSKLATGAATLSLPGIATKAAASDAAKASTGSKIGKIGGAVAGASLILPAAAAVDQAVPKGPGGEWVNSWAPYEKIFTSDLPKAWSISYEAFQVEFAGPMTAWFSNSLPHFFTGQIPMGWDTAYQGFENGFGSPVAAWFTNSLPQFFTRGIPTNVWSPAYQGFENDLGSPIAAWFTNSLPHFFDSGATLAAGWGKDIGNGLTTGWNATAGAVSGAFGAGKAWVSSGFADAGSWLKTAGNDASSGLRSAWNATSGTVASDFSKAKGWATGAVADAGSWLHGAGAGASSGFTSAWNATSGTVAADAGKVRGWVTGALSGAGGWLVAAGASVMGGFLSGLEAQYASVQNFVSGIAGWIAAHKGPVSEDFKLLQPAGTAIMGGFGDALKAEFSGGVQPFVGSIAGILASTAHAQSMSTLSSLGVPSIGSAARLPGVGSPLSTGPMQLQLSYAGSGNQLTDALVGSLRAEIQGQAGGDVQSHLGQGPVRT